MYSACFVISGTMWTPHVTTAMSVDREHRRLSIVVSFEAAQYSETYQVSIHSQALHHSMNVSKVILLHMALISPMMTNV